MYICYDCAEIYSFWHLENFKSLSTHDIIIDPVCRMREGNSSDMSAILYTG